MDSMYAVLLNSNSLLIVSLFYCFVRIENIYLLVY